MRNPAMEKNLPAQAFFFGKKECLIASYGLQSQVVNVPLPIQRAMYFFTVLKYESKIKQWSISYLKVKQYSNHCLKYLH